MTSFNKTLTIEEATELLKFRGTAMWPDTKHNREMIASVIHAQLQQLHNTKKALNNF